ncbi:hypothetical protein PQD13_gp71 [Gordonia phage Clawz]|uniref:Uncharacterized protein n=1 Tax=Gordonia phage Clawz TaxID=2743910 RepID=A0AAE7F8V3_9CAUD|nr:hypothetical protein PQD13_gp71 [Gordonia phage Clawz]QKY79983.1 hypothetical protein SEA_CLAWZ_71 [Gordonia phage Clawz]
MIGRDDRGPAPSAPEHLLTLGVGDARYLSLSEVADREAQIRQLKYELMGDTDAPPRLLCEALSNRSYTVSTSDLFAGVSWDPGYDPYGMFYPAGQGSGWGYASYARIRIPVSGRYRLEWFQHMARSGAAVGDVAGKIMAKTGTGAPTVTADSISTDLIRNVSATDGPVRAFGRFYLEAGTYLYWSSWASPYKNVVQYGFGNIRTSMRVFWAGSV